MMMMDGVLAQLDAGGKVADAVQKVTILADLIAAMATPYEEVETVMVWYVVGVIRRSTTSDAGRMLRTPTDT